MTTRRGVMIAGAVVLVGAAGAFYVQARGQIAAEQEKMAAATVQLADLQTQIDSRSASTGASDPTGSEANPADVAASVAPTNIDWPAVQRAVDEGSAPLGVSLASFQGAFVPAQIDPTSVAGARMLGTLTLSATAPSVPAVADWLDWLAADPRFADPWVSGLTITIDESGSKAVQFTMAMSITGENLVDHISTTEAQP